MPIVAGSILGRSAKYIMVLNKVNVVKSLQKPGGVVNKVVVGSGTMHGKRFWSLNGSICIDCDVLFVNGSEAVLRETKASIMVTVS